MFELSPLVIPPAKHKITSLPVPPFRLSTSSAPGPRHQPFIAPADGAAALLAASKENVVIQVLELLLLETLIKVTETTSQSIMLGITPRRLVSWRTFVDFLERGLDSSRDQNSSSSVDPLYDLRALCECRGVSAIDPARDTRWKEKELEEFVTLRLQPYLYEPSSYDQEVLPTALQRSSTNVPSAYSRSRAPESSFMSRFNDSIITTSTSLGQPTRRNTGFRQDCTFAPPQSHSAAGLYPKDPSFLLNSTRPWHAPLQRRRTDDMEAELLSEGSRSMAKRWKPEEEPKQINVDEDSAMDSEESSSDLASDLERLRQDIEHDLAGTATPSEKENVQAPATTWQRPTMTLFDTPVTYKTETETEENTGSHKEVLFSYELHTKDGWSSPEKAKDEEDDDDDTESTSSSGSNTPTKRVSHSQSASGDLRPAKSLNSWLRGISAAREDSSSGSLNSRLTVHSNSELSPNRANVEVMEETSFPHSTESTGLKTNAKGKGKAGSPVPRRVLGNLNRNRRSLHTPPLLVDDLFGSVEAFQTPEPASRSPGSCCSAVRSESSEDDPVWPSEDFVSEEATSNEEDDDDVVSFTDLTTESDSEAASEVGWQDREALEIDEFLRSDNEVVAIMA